MSRPRVLLFAYHFPPENSVGAARPYRFAKYLPGQGFDCHVISAAEPGANPEGSTEYIADPFQEGSGHGFGFQIERALRRLLLPGATGTQWAVQAYRAGRRYVERQGDAPTAIYSTFPPLGVHLAAYRLATKTKAPWIADFRDPMAFNPATDRLAAHTKRLYKLFESRIVHTAAAILANTDAAQNLLHKNFPRCAGKVYLLPNGFDPAQRTLALPIPKRTARVFSHTGELYEGRTIAPILLGLKRLFDAGRLSPGSVRIELIGPMQPNCLPAPEFVRNAEGAGWLSITPRQIPRPEAQAVAQTSDGLLIIQPQSAIQIPGKLFEYVQIGRPILAFVPRDSAIERLLAQSGVPYRCVYAEAPNDVVDRILLEYFALPSTPVQPSVWFEETFNAQTQTAFLARLISQQLSATH